jgi:hypothetical protein
MSRSTKTPDAASKAAAKPRKAATKKADVLQMEAAKSNPLSQAGIPYQQVAELAHRFWNERGRTHGHDADDWFRAEELLRGKAS